MRYLIISDIHANYAALEAVLADAGPFDKIWCLGDLVGYGPQPNECITRLRKFPLTCLVGNHDWAVIGKLDLRYFNNEARTACVWTRNALTPENRAYLESLPAMCVESGYTLAHGSPSHPIEEYILDATSAEHNFAAFDTRVCLVGHTHWPTAFWQDDSRDHFCFPRPPLWRQPITLDAGRWIINPGSVGQPRDGNPRACYALLNIETNVWEYRRVAYSVEETQLRMREHGLSKRLIDRLASGH